MTAIRVTEPSGSNGAIQFANNGVFDTDAGLIFNTTTQRLGIGTAAPDTLLHVAGQTTVGSTATDLHAMTGSLSVSVGLTGSLTNLADGTSFLIAGSNMTLTTGSNGAVTVASTAGSSIGDAEDGDYSDGLYTDFTTDTNIGTAVDRFNEVLKALAPAPAPALDDIDVNSDGTDVELSFGSSNDQSSASPAYASVSTAAGFSAVDVNETYQTATAGNNLRAAVFDGTTNIIGELNEDVAQNINGTTENHPANSFGDADDGVLQLEVNGSLAHEIDLTVNGIGVGGSGVGTGNHVNGNGSGFINFSAATTGTFENGNEFASFKHRTGQFKVHTADQRNGWNYARVLHVRTGSTQTANHVEWVNDDDSSALAAAGNTSSFIGSGSFHLSGIEYFESGTFTYQTRVTNAYKYVYDTNNITFASSIGGSVNSGQSLTLAAQTKPTIDTGSSETHAKVLHLTSSAALTADYMIGGSVSADVSVTHPMKTNLTNGGTATTSNILIYTASNTSTDLSETFSTEDYRIQSGAYDTQAAVTNAGNVWDSTVHMSGSNTGYQDGLMCYIGSLYSPKNGGSSGNFQYANGPAENPNYSSITAGVKTFYRRFRNTTGRPVHNLSWATSGAAVTLVGESDAIGSNNRVRVFFKHSPNGSGGGNWVDAKTAFTYHDTDNRSGGRGPTTVDTSLASATNYITFGTGSVANNDYVVMKIEADDDWSGSISSVTVVFGAEGAINVAPDLADIDCNNSGIDASLSFGSSLALAGYSNVDNSAGFGAVNTNGDYDRSGNRKGIFNGATNIAGNLNETVAASGNNYDANSFGGGNAHTGSLKLEVNGSVVHTFDLNNSFAANSDTGGGGSGFNLAAASVSRDSNNVPDWTRFFRTGLWTVVSGDQRKGHNYARVIHEVTGTQKVSTYAEWVNDPDGAAATVTMSSPSIVNFRSDSTYTQSGITYFVSPNADFVVTGSNVYKYVYSENSNALRFPTTTNCAVVSVIVSGSGVVNSSTAAAQAGLPNLDTSASDAYNRDIFVTGTLSFDHAASIPGGTAYTVAASGRVHHPVNGNTTSSTVTSNTLLVYTSVDNSTQLEEKFSGEAKRLISGSYVNQASVTDSDNAWDGSISMNGADAGHNTGLAVYNDKLVAPANTGNSGDFRSTGDGGTLASPAGNPNYTNVTNTTREYTRWFQNTAAGSKTDFVLSVSGSGTVVSPGTSLGSSNKLEIHAKIPLTTSDFKTGWMDMTSAFETGKNSDDDGCLVGALDNSLDTVITGTFGTQSVAANEYILIRIIADKTWTGNISYMMLEWV